MTKPRARRPGLPSNERLLSLQRDTFSHFWREANPANGLLPDNTHQKTAPASVAGVGLALAAYVVGVTRGFVTRAEALERILATLRFFWASSQAGDNDATGYHGFYFHFLDVKTGRRAWRCELSTIDTAIFLAGALTAAHYFDNDAAADRELRELADALYRRANWQWAQNGGAAITHGWTPEHGFLPYRWTGYNEALLLYVLALGSPTFPAPADGYDQWTSTYRWRKIYGYELLYGGPLFIHQFSHLWIDFRGIQDAFMRAKCIDYFENSRRATYVQREYAIRNPRRFVGYGEFTWGLSASNGPGPVTLRLNGKTRHFLGYSSRGVPFGPDDGTLAPWTAAASLPFAPEIVLPTIDHYLERLPRAITKYGLMCSINPTFRRPSQHKTGWVSHGHFTLNQGPVILMIENYRTGLIWRLMRRCPFIVNGLRRAGFEGGWLGTPVASQD